MRGIDAFPATSANYADIFRLIGEFESLLQFDEICLGLSKRVAVAVSAEWQTVEDSVRFWSADYGDEESDPVGFETFCRIRSRIRLKQKLFGRIKIRSRIWSRGSGINNFGSGSRQPLTRMNLKQNFSAKIPNFSTKCTI
jgi:hypothetical protein